MTSRSTIRSLQADDVPQIIALCERTYPGSPPWSERQLLSHVAVFPDGQFVAVDAAGVVRGYAASLIVKWDDYKVDAPWKDWTASGMFTNHNPGHGRTLYGAEVMVDPTVRGSGIGGRLYTARRRLARRLQLPRIRAAARLRGYHKYADQMSAADYTLGVIAKRYRDPTLSFQLREWFEVFGVVSGYLQHDPESLGWAALIEWMNWRVATEDDRAMRDARFARHGPS
jgi:ribosomal protein S18 acetylase RimI-like enzyme